MSHDLRLTRLPGESPCVFDFGADGYTECIVHGWVGGKEQRSRVLVCPWINTEHRADDTLGPRDRLRAALVDVQWFLDDPMSDLVPTLRGIRAVVGRALREDGAALSDPTPSRVHAGEFHEDGCKECQEAPDGN